MKYLTNYNLFEAKEEKKYTGVQRIILLGPPTVGKSTISKELSKELGLEIVSLDMNQGKFGGFGEKNEVDCVEWALSNKVKTPSILDFGGGHVYHKGVQQMISEYGNIFVLIPSEDYETSCKILRDNSRETEMAKMIDHILKSLQSPQCEFTEAKRAKLIKKAQKIHAGGAGELGAEDIPKASHDKFGHSLRAGFDTAPDWLEAGPNLYTKRHDKINRSLGANIIEVFTPKGRRRSLSAIVNEIIKKLK